MKYSTPTVSGLIEWIWLRENWGIMGAAILYRYEFSLENLQIRVGKNSRNFLKKKAAAWDWEEKYPLGAQSGWPSPLLS
jgi:hypothetical protein